MIGFGVGAQDALDEIARQRQRDLSKPLRVHFIGEPGIDAGGLKKEFFQLLLAELLCPDYGMLLFQQVPTTQPSTAILTFDSRSQPNLPVNESGFWRQAPRLLVKDVFISRSASVQVCRRVHSKSFADLQTCSIKLACVKLADASPPTDAA